MSKTEKDYEQVGNIRIKEIKPKKQKGKKISSNTNETSIGIKIFVWIMFFAMALGAAAPLAYYIITAMTSN